MPFTRKILEKYGKFIWGSKMNFWSGILGAARTETGDAFGPKGLGSVRRVPDIRMSCKVRFGTEDSQTHPIPRGWANERFVILVHPMKVYALNKGFHRHKLGKEVYFEKTDWIGTRIQISALNLPPRWMDHHGKLWILPSFMVWRRQGSNLGSF